MDVETGKPKPRFWEQKRPTHLLTGRVFCGECSTALQSVGRDYLACRVATAAGPCSSRASVRRGPLEALILGALSSEMMLPELVTVFVEEFTAEWNRLSCERSGAAAGRRRELALVERKLAGLIDAIADGLRTAGLREKLEELEARQAKLRTEIAADTAGNTAPLLHPNLAEIYRVRVQGLRAAMQKSASPETREALRALIARVEIHHARDGETEPRIELFGHLASLLRAGGAEVPVMFLSSQRGCGDPQPTMPIH